METASKVVPQGRIVQTVKETWKFAWKRMMTELAPQDEKGSYKRPSYSFGGAIGDKNFPIEPGRYHLYVGNPCPVRRARRIVVLLRFSCTNLNLTQQPHATCKRTVVITHCQHSKWCHRARLALLVRGISGEEVGVTQLVDDPIKASRGGWVFSSRDPDPCGNNGDLRELYDQLSPGFTGRCTAPLLVDLKSKRIVSNDSASIVRMLGRPTTFGNVNVDLYPIDLAKQIDDVNEWVYQLLNNGVYRCGFSTSQVGYDEASADVQEGLRRCEHFLSKSGAFLCGSRFTEADLRLLPTMLRFDGVYSPLFKAGGSHLKVRDFPAIHAWLRRCWSVKGVPESIDLADACGSYYKQLFPLNPGGIIPSPVTAASIGLG